MYIMYSLGLRKNMFFNIIMRILKSYQIVIGFPNSNLIFLEFFSEKYFPHCFMVVDDFFFVVCLCVLYKNPYSVDFMLWTPFFCNLCPVPARFL